MMIVHDVHMLNCIYNKVSVPEPPWLRAVRLLILHAKMEAVLHVLYREPVHATPVLNSRSQISMSICS